MDWITQPETWIAFLTLVALELVLGVDNVIFISILASKLPQNQQQSARRTGIMLAVVTRILLLLSISWIIGLTEPLFAVAGFDISGRDVVLIAGGLFLLWKSVHEIHGALEGVDEDETSAAGAAVASFGGVLVQIAILDIVFSLDSVITAVGLADQISVMVLAILISVAVMMFAAKGIGEFVDRHPTIKMLALSFLVLVGVTLIAEGFGTHVPKGYIYFAMAFSVAVEMINIRLRKRMVKPVQLRKDMPG